MCAWVSVYVVNAQAWPSSLAQLISTKRPITGDVKRIPLSTLAFWNRQTVQPCTAMALIWEAAVAFWAGRIDAACAGLLLCCQCSAFCMVFRLLTALLILGLIQLCGVCCFCSPHPCHGEHTTPFFPLYLLYSFHPLFSFCLQAPWLSVSVSACCAKWLRVLVTCLQVSSCWDGLHFQRGVIEVNHVRNSY